MTLEAMYTIGREPLRARYRQGNRQIGIRGSGRPALDPKSGERGTPAYTFQPNRGFFRASKKPASQTHLGAGPLKPGMVSVWWMATDHVGAAECDRWFGILDRSERERADRFRF